MKLWMRRAAVGAALLLVAAGTGSAIAAAVVPSGSVYVACVNTSARRTLYNLRVNPGSTPACRRGDFRISWNQTGPQGPIGPQGPAGPAGSGFSDVQTVTQLETVSAGFVKQAIADCPAGYTATGGGFQGSPALILTESAPLLDHRSDPPLQAWSIITKDTDSIDLDETAYAVCVR